ncbi:DCC1-like thiol-disulfide oxidoreductase family protein [Limibacter armeniacum]|uniref:DCC1-like thiol-disulfide oxidoreductase family protein n=1 Tax=Limibacter armeniacum TaxID=466084 RepID=UPI0038CC08A2
MLFDGVCNLCDSTIQYIIKHDSNNLFYFAPLKKKPLTNYCTTTNSKLFNQIIP